MSKKVKNPTLQSISKLAKQRIDFSKLALQNNPNDLMHKLEEMKKTFQEPTLQKAFKTTDMYSNTLKAFDSSLNTKDVSSIQKLFESKIPSSLTKEYGLAFKATEQFKRVEDTLKSLGISVDKDHLYGLSALAFNTDNPLEYAQKLSKATTGLSQLSLSNYLDSLQTKKKKYFEKEEEKRKKQIEKLSISLKPSVQYKDNIQEKLSEFHTISTKIVEAQRRKEEKKEIREQGIYENSEIQVELLKSIMKYMDTQNQSSSLQNEILSEQVEKIKIQNNQSEEQITEIKKQNKLMQEQQEENRKSSKTAVWIAIASILIGVIVGIGSIYFSYLFYQWEDKSDNKNHRELLQTIQKTGNSQDLAPLIQEQIKFTGKTNKLLREIMNTNQVNKKITNSKK